MSSAVYTAGRLHAVLDSLRGGGAASLLPGLDPAALKGRTAREVMDVVIEAVRPVDGTQDAEADRQAIASATSDLLNQFTDADIMALSVEQIDFLLERFIAHDLCRRLELDVGTHLVSHAPSPQTAVRMLEEMENYVLSRVQSVINGHRSAGERFEPGRIAAFVQSILGEVLRVFEEYLR